MTGPSLTSNGPDDTRAWGERLGALVEPGDIILLSGELGAGKTVFVQGIARGLGFEGSVSSKSFVLLGEYRGRLTLYHADLYRLQEPEQVEELALDEVSAGGVLVVEWPERAGPRALPEVSLLIQFEVLDDTRRLLRLLPRAGRGDALVRALTPVSST